MPQFFLHLVMLGLISSGFLAVFLSLVILRQRQKTTRIHLVMGLLLITLAASAGLNAYFSLLVPKQFPNLTSLPEPFLLLIGPLFFEYIVQLNGGRFSLGRLCLHLTPFVFVCLYLLVLAMSADPLPNFLFIAWIWLGIFVHYWVYFFLNLKRLKEYRHRLKGLHSSMDSVYQAWISFCLKTLLVFYSIQGVLFLLQHGQIFLPINRSLAILLALMIYSIAYRILTRPELFAPVFLTRNGLSEPISSPPPTSRSASADAFHHQSLPLSGESKGLLALMDASKPFTNPGLDLKSLADQIDMSPHHLSQLINHELQTNFYDLVNRYRVEEAKRLLADSANDHLTVIALAHDAGFNSKATFNRMFKKVTGQTPSQFRRERKTSDTSTKLNDSIG